ncbi:MAG: SDR family oxidoreductase [Candidatus Aureabacteria bacterium]|nr:SDR family oxidoreductase [Candidatus Auribacterota bacterium]
MTTILITGASGMLGKDIVELFSSDRAFSIFGAHRHFSHYLKNIHQLTGDLTDKDFVKHILETIHPEIIIYCAANVDVDNCEKEKVYTRKLHVEALEHFASWYPEKTQFISVSTDSVFDGQKGNYCEEDEPVPLNYYAESKLEGEKAALQMNPSSLILRTNLYGFHVPSNRSLVEWALENLFKNRTIQGFTDVYFNPVYTKQLARIIKKCILEIRNKGILHIGSNKYVSKYEFLINLAEVFNLSEKLIVPCRFDESSFTAKRPKNTTLNTKKQKRFGVEIPDLEKGLLELKRDYQITRE